jgi:predicted ATP-dependent serine protease
VGSVVWIEDEPGIGKSSLVAEAMSSIDPEWDIG